MLFTVSLRLSHFFLGSGEKGDILWINNNPKTRPKKVTPNDGSFLPLNRDGPC